jgi:hypothetical protein
MSGNELRAEESTSLLEHDEGHHRRKESFVPEIVFTSIENFNEAFHEVQEQIGEMAHDCVTFEPLDPDSFVAQAEEDGTIDLDPLSPDEVELLIHPEDPMDPFTSHEKLGVLPLAVIVFYNVSGGPFGIETSVRAGGNFFALLGFLIMPFIWSAQEALMTAELGTAFPEASAGVAWVEEAFGTSAGWMCGYLGWIAGGMFPLPIACQ